MSLFINKLTTPRTLSNNELLVNGLFLFEKPKQISDFEFFSSNNRSFTKEDLLGKWTVMYFGFSRCPDECPTTMYELSKLVKILRDKNYNLDNKQWVLVTIDPERDSPEDIDKYAKGFDDDFMGPRTSLRYIAPFAHTALSLYSSKVSSSLSILSTVTDGCLVSRSVSGEILYCIIR